MTIRKKKNMKNWKKAIIIGILIVVGVVCVFMYWNQHLYYRAEKTEEPEEKIVLLEKASRLYSLNDAVRYELGKAYLDSTALNLDNPELRQEYFKKALVNFEKAININPVDRYSHFNYGQALSYQDFILPFATLPTEKSPFAEYKKAALLAGHHSEVYFEVGKILLTHWERLSDDDRVFATDCLRKIMGQKRQGQRENILTLLHVWNMNVKDYEVLGRILPEEAAIYRQVGEFLGEMSLSVKERQNALAKAEGLEFQNARNEYELGMEEFNYFGIEKATRHFESCLRMLQRINFYQVFAQEVDGFGVAEFNDLQKSATLYLLKCRVEQGGKLKDIQKLLQGYLVLEGSLASVTSLEDYLTENGLFHEQLGTSFDDLRRVMLHCLVAYKANRYRDLIRLGRLLRESFVVVPEDKKDDYKEILCIVGDAFQKVDFIYDAGEFYSKALEIDKGYLKALLKLRQNYERLNEEEKIQEINEKIKSVMAPENIIKRKADIKKRGKFSRALVFDGEKITLFLRLDDEGGGIPPLVSIIFNGRVIWEDYIKEWAALIPLETKPGVNTLVIRPVNKGVKLIELKYQ